MAGIEQAKNAFWDLIKHWKSDKDAELVFKSEDGDLEVMLSVNIGHYSDPAAASRGLKSSWRRAGPRRATAEQAVPPTGPASYAPKTPEIRSKRRSKGPSGGNIGGF